MPVPPVVMMICVDGLTSCDISVSRIAAHDSPSGHVMAMRFEQLGDGLPAGVVLIGAGIADGQHEAGDRRGRCGLVIKMAHGSEHTTCDKVKGRSRRALSSVG